MQQPYLQVYRASAGSGKTFTLVAQFLAYLLSTDDITVYRHVLAVTFTNKATNEMKERLLQQLYGIAHHLPSSQSYLDKVSSITNTTSQELITRAKRVLTFLVYDYGNLHVETIDAFFQKILSAVSYELNLPANLQISLNDKDIIAEAVSKFMQQVSPDTAPFNWLTDYMIENIKQEKSWNVANSLETFAKEIYNEDFMNNEAQLMESLSHKETITNFIQELRHIEKCAIETINKNAEHTKKHLIAVLPEEHISFKNHLFNYLDRLQSDKVFSDKKKDEITSSIIKKIESPEAWLSKAKRSQYIQEAQQAQSLLQSLETDRKQQLYHYLSARYTLEKIYPLCLLGEINRWIDKLNTAYNHFMIGKVNFFLKSLKGEADASFVFERVGTRFDHIMIDEFQDTSKLQWENFKNLMIEHIAAGHSSLLVGDGKQSIYRFRAGDWSILQNINKEIKRPKLHIETLNTNYRSCANIVTFNNAFFLQAIQILKDHITDDTFKAQLTHLYSDVKQEVSPAKKQGAQGYVHVEIVYEQEDTQEDKEIEQEQEQEHTPPKQQIYDKMALAIDSLLERGISPQDIAILVRKNQEGSDLVQYFEQIRPSLKFVSSEAYFLRKATSVQLLIAALSHLNDPTDLLSLTILVQGYTHHVHPESPPPLHLTRSAQLALLPQAYSQLLDQYLQLPLYELTEQLIAILQLNSYRGEEIFLFTFLDEMLSFINEKPATLPQFLTLWHTTLSPNKTIPAGSIDGITITTIHKSKGLEFRSVLLPFFHWEIEYQKSDTNKLLWVHNDATPYNRLPLLPIPIDKRLKHSHYQHDLAKEIFMRQVDTLNLLYVAFTRAVDNLYIWSLHKVSKSVESAAHCDNVSTLIEHTMRHLTPSFSPVETQTADDNQSTPSPLSVYTLGDKDEAITPQKHKVSDNRLAPDSVCISQPFDVHTHRIDFVQSNASRTLLTSSEVGIPSPHNTYILVGNILHQIFANIATQADIRPMINRFEREGLLDPYINRDELLHTIQQGLSNPTVASWFDGSWQLYKECAIVYRDPATGKWEQKRPDRVMIKGDQTIVVDFKFGEPHPEHHTQISAYMSLLQEMGTPHRPEGYLWYVTKGLVEPVS